MVNTAISENLYDKWLSELIESDMSEAKKQELLGKLTKFHEVTVQNALAFMLSNLYNHDYDDLKRDLVKIIMLDSDKEPDPAERVELLRVLWWCIEARFSGDYSLILNECEKAIDYFVENDDYDYSDLPFV